MRFVTMFFLGLCAVCMWSCGKSDEGRCTNPFYDQCQEMRWQDGKCVIGDVVPDGQECLFKFGSDFCVSECVCQDGKARQKERVCDNGNHCMVGLCERERVPNGVRMGPDTRGKCFFYAGDDGKTCGKDNTGVCWQGLCIKQVAIIPPSQAPLEPAFSFSP